MLQKLPNDILGLIFDKLPAEERVRLTLVHRELRNFCDPAALFVDSYTSVARDLQQAVHHNQGPLRDYSSFVRSLGRGPQEGEKAWQRRVDRARAKQPEFFAQFSGTHEKIQRLVRQVTPPQLRDDQTRQMEAARRDLAAVLSSHAMSGEHFEVEGKLAARISDILLGDVWAAPRVPHGSVAEQARRWSAGVQDTTVSSETKFSPASTPTAAPKLRRARKFQRLMSEAPCTRGVNLALAAGRASGQGATPTNAIF